MIEKRTVIDQIEVTRDAHVQIRLALEVVEDGEVILQAWHRAAIEPGGDIDATISAVNADIASRSGLRARAIGAERVPLLKAITDLVHTPELIADFQAKHRDDIKTAGA